MGNRALLLGLSLLLCADSAYALTTRLYFTISSGVRALSTTAPVETGIGDTGTYTGADIVGDSGVAACPAGGNTDKVYSPYTQYKFIVPDTLGKDVDIDSDLYKYTYFQYYARLADGETGGYTRPMIQVTYRYNTTGYPEAVELMGAPQTCDVDTVNPPVKFSKETGGNIAMTSTLKSGTILSSLPAGSTVMIDVWSAGQSSGTDGAIVSTASYPSYIDIPYAEGNFAIRGKITPAHVHTYAGSPASFTYTMYAVDSGTPDIQKLEITVPGGIAGTTLFFDSINITSVSQACTTTFTNATMSQNGKITVDFSATPLGVPAVFQIVFDAKSPVAEAKTVKWDGLAVTGSGSFPLTSSPTGTDSLYMAVLPTPAAPASVSPTPANTFGTGGQVNVLWAALDGNAAAVTAYQVWRDGSPVATVPTAGSYFIAGSSWKPGTSIVLASPAPGFTDTGLVNGTSYVYTVKTINPVGESALSSPAAVTPYENPKAPTGLTTYVADRSALVRWTAAAPGTYPVSRYEVYRSDCLVCSYSLYSTIWSDTVTLFSDSALSNSAVYSYYVRALDDQGHPGSVSPSDSGTPAVNPPTGLTPSYDYGLPAVNLQWQASEGNLYPLSGYNVYRGTCSGCELSLLGSPGPTASAAATLFQDSAVTAAKFYLYLMSALSKEGDPLVTEGPMTAPVRVMTPPWPPTGLTVEGAAGTALFLRWDLASNPAGVVSGYRVYRATTSGVATTFLKTVTPQAVTSYQDTAVSAGKRYYYQVLAYYQEGADSGESAKSATSWWVVEPGAPLGLTAAPGDGVVRLNWSDLRPEQEVDLYNVYRSTQAAFSTTVFLSSVGTTFFDDSTVTNGIVYYYRLTAGNLGGVGPPSGTLGVSPFKGATAPGWLSAVAGYQQVSLFWSPATAGSYALDGYEIVRSTFAGGATCSGCDVTTFYVPGSSTSVLTDYGLDNGVPYFYSVRARDVIGNPGNWSNEASSAAAMPPCAPSSVSTVSSTGWLDLAWTIVDPAACVPKAGTFPVSGYLIFRTTTSGLGYSLLVASPGAAATAYTDAYVTAGRTYYYAIKTFDSQIPSNESLSYSAESCGTPRVPAQAPASLTIFYGLYEHDRELKLAWSPAAAGTLPVIGYNVYRSTAVGAAATRIYVSGGATASYLDTGLVNNAYYYYRVASVEERLFEGGWAAVSGTPYANPVPPAALTVAAERPTEILLKWTAAAATTYPVSGYQVLRATWPGIVNLAALNVLPHIGLTYTDTGLLSGMRYYYHLKTFDDRLHLSAALSNETSGVPYVSPGTPGGLTAHSGPSRITVSWGAASAGTYPVSGYVVYHATYPALLCGGTYLAAVGGGVLQYVHAGLTDVSVPHYYSVAAFDAQSISHVGACSSTVSGFSGGADPPLAPVNLSGIAGDAVVGLTWQGAAAGSNPVSGYNIYRSTYGGNPAGAGQLLGQSWAGPGTSVYSDTTAANGVAYYYRVRARDDAALVSVPSNEFRAFPAQPPGSFAAVGGAGIIRLSWLATTVTAPGALEVTGYNVYRSTVAGGAYSLVTSLTKDADPNSATFYSDTNVTSGLPVNYMVAARHLDGWLSPFSSISGVTSGSPPSSPPLFATSGDSVAWLNWGQATGDFPPVTSYEVYRATDSGGPWSDLGRAVPPPSPRLSYTDTGAANGTPYYYQVRAVDSEYTSGPNETASNVVFVLPLGAPLALSAFPGDSRIGLGWSPSADTTGTGGYFVYRRTLTESETLLAAVPGAGASVYADSAAVNGVAYFYRVQAYDSAVAPTNVSLYSNETTAVAASPPSAPEITAISAGYRSVGLAWSPPSTSGSYPLGGYRLYRSSGPGAYALLASLGTTVSVYSDTNLTNGISWYYKLSAVNTLLPPVEGPYSNEKSAIPYDIPNAPAGLTVELGDAALLVGWTAAVPRTYPVAGYYIYRGTVTNGESTTALNLVPLTTTYYLDTGLVNGTRYFYKVRAIDTEGHLSLLSAEVSGVSFAPPGAPSMTLSIAGNSLAVLGWSVPAAGTYSIAAYNLYRSLVPSPGATVLLKGGIASTMFVDTSAVNATAYYYVVRAADTLGNESADSNEANLTPSAAVVNPPLDVRATPADGSITLNWSFTVDGAAPGGPISGYNIYRGTCATCLAFLVYGTNEMISFTDTTVTNAVSYFYAVRSYSVGPPPAESLDYAGLNAVSTVPSDPPGVPGSVVATAGLGAVELKWNASTAGTFAISAYRVYRVVSGSAPAAPPMATVSASLTVYNDFSVVNGVTYQYFIAAVDSNGTAGGLGASNLVTPGDREDTMFLSRNAFAPLRGERLEITYTLGVASDVAVRIYTIAGLKVWETKMENVPAGPSLGSYVVVGPDGFPGWDGKADDGQYVASGVYLIEIAAGSLKKVQKVILIK